MISNDVRYQATKAHLKLFEQAVANMLKRPGPRTRLEQLELEAVYTPAEVLRCASSLTSRQPW
jgi:hypothetical protein